MENYNIYSIFEKAAELHGQRVAIVESPRMITYDELKTSIDKTASYFLSKGVGSRDRVMVFVPMGIDLYRIVLALYKIGATAVFLDEWVNFERLKICCRLAQCKAYIAVRKVRVLAWFIKELRQIPIKLHDKEYVNYKEESQSEITNADQAALITFTTGSTGTPKAALRTHAFLKEQFDALIEEINPQAGDVDMTTLPIVLLINLGAGATSIIAKFNQKKPAKLDANAIIKQLILNKVNRITASPFFIRRIADQLILKNIRIPDLQFIFTGGAPVFPYEAELFDKAFSPAQTKIAYGSTEAEPISLINAIEVADHNHKNEMMSGLLVGVPYHKTKTKIIEWQDQALMQINELTDGEVGEILVAGPHVLKQYFNNEEALKNNKIKIGETLWHRTGDSGFFNDKGELLLCGRCKTLFHHNGKLVFPFLIEDYLLNLEGVSMGTILKKGNGIEFVIEGEYADRQINEARISELEYHPHSIRWLNHIPRDPRHHSKIDYAKL